MKTNRAMPPKQINIKGLEDYSLSEEGKIFCGDREIRGCWADDITYRFALIPKRCRYPVGYDLHNLWKIVFGKSLPKSVIKSLKSHELCKYNSITAIDSKGVKITFPDIRYASKFLNKSEHQVDMSIKQRKRLDGFKLTGKY